MKDKKWIDENPIKSQGEANFVFTNQVGIISKTLSISIEQAEKRFRALLDSGILNDGSPGDLDKQKQIDEFLMIEK